MLKLFTWALALRLSAGAVAMVCCPDCCCSTGCVKTCCDMPCCK
jgi:hypothetical protein